MEEIFKIKYSESQSSDKIKQVESHVYETKQILSQNLDKLTERGERLHLLVDKTENLCESVSLPKIN